MRRWLSLTPTHSRYSSLHHSYGHNTAHFVFFADFIMFGQLMTPAPLVTAFRPFVNCHCHSLILGTMPGIASLRANEYYAHPRNLFWPIVGDICKFDPKSSYRERTDALLGCGIALWDVLASCKRQGSLDSAIVADSVCVNDFATLFADNPQIRHVYFNGSTAAKLFRKHVTFGPCMKNLTLVTLPSTSPANASQSLAYKRSAWEQILKAFRE